MPDEFTIKDIQTTTSVHPCFFCCQRLKILAGLYLLVPQEVAVSDVNGPEVKVSAFSIGYFEPLFS